MGTNPKTTIDAHIHTHTQTHTQKKKRKGNSNNTQDGHKTTGNENKKDTEAKRHTKINPKPLRK